MKTTITKQILLLLALSLFLLLFSCEEEDKNMSPQFTSINYQDGTRVEKGEIITISLDAEDPDGEVINITLILDNQEVASEDYDYLYYEWNTGDYEVGMHQFMAVATDNEGKMKEVLFQIEITGIELNTPVLESIGSYEGFLYISWSRVNKAKSFNLYWTDDGTTPSASSNKIEIPEDEVYPDTYYRHENLDFTKTYTYRVQAVNGEFVSELSNSRSANPKITALSTPENLQITFDAGKIILSWDQVENDQVTYTLRRRLGAGYYYETLVEGHTSTTYEDDSWESGKGYFYKVRAYDPTYDRTSSETEPVYIAPTMKTVYESELNNEDCGNSLYYDTHYYYAEESTEELDWFTIRGGYTGQYSIYSSYSYKNYEDDCFLIAIEDGDQVVFDLVDGDMGGVWDMSVELIEYGKTTSGSDREIMLHEYTYSGQSHTYNESNTGTVYGVYIKVGMWDDLINYGPYNYEVKFKILRQN